MIKDKLNRLFGREEDDHEDVFIEDEDMEEENE